MKRAGDAVYAYETNVSTYGSPPTLYRATRAACRAHTAAVAVAARTPAGNAPVGVFDRGGQDTVALHGANADDNSSGDDGRVTTRYLVARRRLGQSRMRNADFMVVIGADARVSLLPALNFDLVGTHESCRASRYHDYTEDSPNYLSE